MSFPSPIAFSSSSSLFLVLLFLIPSVSVAQLFLPSSNTQCACPPKGRRSLLQHWDHPDGRHQHPRPHPDVNRQLQIIQQHQREEARKAKALVNLLNVRKKPNKERPMEKSGTNVGLMMKAMNESLLDALRGIETKLAPLKGMRKAKKEKKKQKGSGSIWEKERRRAKRNGGQGPEGNSVLEGPLMPPTTDEGGGRLGRCNSERIRRIIRKAKGRDIGAIKRNIQAMAERQFDAKFNVICASEDFSYISSTEEFCQDQVRGNTCYVFRQLERLEEDEEDGGGGEEESQFEGIRWRRRRGRARNGA